MHKCRHEQERLPARRIQAARLVREVPETLPLIAAGKLTLSNSAKITEFVAAEKIKDVAVTKNLVQEVINRTTRETEDLLLKKAKPDSTFRRKNKCLKVTPSDWELTVTLGRQSLLLMSTLVHPERHDSTKQSLDKIKNLKSHSIKNYEQLFEFLANDYLKRQEKLPKLRKTSAAARCASANMRSHLLKNAGYKCQYPGCEATAFLQADHKMSAARGGETALTNLQVLCRAHNHRKLIKGH